jgi:hypothetical protein
MHICMHISFFMQLMRVAIGVAGRDANPSASNFSYTDVMLAT